MAVKTEKQLEGILKRITTMGGCIKFCSDHVLEENFIVKWQHQLPLVFIVETQKLSENFIREHKDRVNWEGISRTQVLTEDFIEEMQDKVHWANIGQYQNVSKLFLLKHMKKIPKTSIYKNNKIRPEDKEELLFIYTIVNE